MARTSIDEKAKGGSDPIQVRIVADERHFKTAWEQLAAGRPLEVTVVWTPGRGASPEPPRRYVRRLAVLERQDRIRYLKVEDIDWIKAERQYLRLYARDGDFLARGKSMTISDLASRLDPERFMRVHRSHIVNLEQVEALRTEDSVKRYAVLAGGHDVPVSQAHWEQLQIALTGG